MADTPQDSIISWNATNWVTVTLMATIGFFLVGLAQRWYASRKG